MRIIRNIVIVCAIALAIIMVGFWQYHQRMVATYAKQSIAEAYHVPQSRVIVEGVQELGNWPFKLNSFTAHSWAVFFHLNQPYPVNLQHMGTIDESSFGHFNPPDIPGPDLFQPSNH